MDTLSKNCKAVGKAAPQALTLCLLNSTALLRKHAGGAGEQKQKETGKASKQAQAPLLGQHSTAAVKADAYAGKSY